MQCFKVTFLFKNVVVTIYGSTDNNLLYIETIFTTSCLPFHCFQSQILRGRLVISEVGFMQIRELSISFKLFPK